jgi:ferrochelatase
LVLEGPGLISFSGEKVAMIDKTAILLLQMGGPDSLEAVEPFLLNLFLDRDIIRLGPAFFQPVLARWISRRRAPKVEAQYEKIGGRSPIRELTSAQALALEEKLGQGFRCFPAMRYWRPSIIEALAAVKKEGISRIFALPLYPHYSRATTGSSFNELRRVLTLSGVKFSFSCIESFHNHPLYIAALARTLEEGLGFFPEGQDVTLLFSAHSLPVSFIESGDPYLSQVEETVRLVMERFPKYRYQLAFQSKAGPVKWLEPATEEAITRLAADGCKNMLMVPVSFVCDHIETLYEIDVTYAALAQEQGIANFRRSPSLNTSPLFIDCLADLVRTALLSAR